MTLLNSKLKTRLRSRGHPLRFASPLLPNNCQLSTVNCQLSTVNCQLSTVNYSPVIPANEQKLLLSELPDSP
ncbi:MAG: hypothetical protein HC786_13660 [Richelia sp. CSU_2_1]|nr:hypothetical protein [Microcoleus sp. SM1_3_4]NJR23124.1 hypothetical protein [Richelia sp. CSU_2_1]